MRRGEGETLKTAWRILGHVGGRLGAPGHGLRCAKGQDVPWGIVARRLTARAEPLATVGRPLATVREELVGTVW